MKTHRDGRTIDEGIQGLSTFSKQLHDVGNFTSHYNARDHDDGAKHVVVP